MSIRASKRLTEKEAWPRCLSAGHCPANWMQSGNYCIDTRVNPPAASGHQKLGQCSSGEVHAELFREAKKVPRPPSDLRLIRVWLRDLFA